ncbi:MAG: PDZ domain-containing protein, partial [bacterium]
KDKKGVVVSGLLEDSPAGKAGVRQGDVIVEFDGKKVETMQQSQQFVAVTPVGDKVEVVVIRDGERKKFSVKIGRQPENLERLAEGTGEPGGEEVSGEKLGMRVQELTPEIAERLGLKGIKGVVVTDVKTGSPADNAGIRTRDVILELNKNKITNLKDFNRITAGIKPGDSVLALVNRGGHSQYIVIKVPKK